MTFIDIQNSVKTNVIDLPPAVAVAVPKLINDTIREAEGRYNFKYMEQTAAFVTTPGQLSIGTISNFKEYMDRGPYVQRQFSKAYDLYVTTDNGDTNKAQVLNPAYPKRPEHIFNVMSDANTAFQFYVLPYPDALSDWSDGNYRIYVPYYKYSDVLVADGDTNWLVNRADDYIISKATAEAFKKEWDYNSAAVWLQDAENKFMRIRATDKKLRLSGVTTLVPHWEGGKQGMGIK